MSCIKHEWFAGNGLRSVQHFGADFRRLRSEEDSQFSQSSDDLLALGVALLGLLLRLRLLGFRLLSLVLRDHLALDSGDEVGVKVSSENESPDFDRIVFGLLAWLAIFLHVAVRNYVSFSGHERWPPVRVETEAGGGARLVLTLAVGYSAHQLCRFASVGPAIVVAEVVFVGVVLDEDVADLFGFIENRFRGEALDSQSRSNAVSTVPAEIAILD